MDLRDEVISQALCSRRTVGVCSLPHHRRNARSLPTGRSQARALVEPRCQSSAPCSPTHRPPRGNGLCSTGPAGLTRLGGGHNPGAQPWQNRIPTLGRNPTCDGSRCRDGTTKAVRAGPGPQRVRQIRHFATKSGQRQALCRSRWRSKRRCHREMWALDSSLPGAGALGMTSRVGIAADHGGFVLNARFSGTPRHQRQLAEPRANEHRNR